MPDGPTDTETNKMSRRLAGWLVGLFAAMLVAMFVAAVFLTDGGESSAWLELFKSGFLILGGMVTTVIGYYFGHRTAEEAQDQAAHAIAGKARAETQKQRLEEELAAPTFDESALELPDEPDEG